MRSHISVCTHAYRILVRTCACASVMLVAICACEVIAVLLRARSHLSCVDIHFVRPRDDKCVCLLLQYLLQSCSRGGRGIVEDMCYERRQAEDRVD